MEGKDYTIVFFNCNSDRRLDGFEGDCYPQIKSINRLDSITKLLIDPLDDYTILILFELDDKFLNGFIDKIKNRSNYYYNYSIYNRSALAFRYLVITKLKSVTETLKVYPLTISGKFVENERPTCDLEEYGLYHKEVLYDNFEKSVIQIKLYDLDIYCIHMGLNHLAREYQSKKLIEIVKKESENRRFIIGGDFNSFNLVKHSPKVYNKDLDIICDKLNATCKTIDLVTTFTPFPYDIYFLISADDILKLQNLKDMKNYDGFRLYCETMSLKHDTINCGVLDHLIFSKYGHSQSFINVIPPQNYISDHYIMKAIVKI
jgi:hypothetical protein